MPECMAGYAEFTEKVFPGDTVRQTNAMLGLSAFKHGDGLYGRAATIEAAKNMPGYRWAQMFSGPYPDFQVVQTIVLALFTMQSPTERNHKLEAMAKTKSRNRLKSITTDKVLYICCNERLKQKTQKILYQEEYLQWLEAAPEADGLSADLLSDHNSARKRKV